MSLIAEMRPTLPGTATLPDAGFVDGAAPTTYGAMISVTPRATVVEFKFPNGHHQNFISAGALAKWQSGTTRTEGLIAAMARYAYLAWTDDVIGAAHYVAEILRLGHRLHFATSTNGAFNVAAIPDPEARAAVQRHLEALSVSGRCPLHRNLVNAAAIGLAQTEFAAGSRETSVTFLRYWFQRSGRHHVIDDVLQAQERIRQDGNDVHPLVRNLAEGGLAYLDHFKGRFCDRPFKEFEFTSTGDVFVCCPNFLPTPIGNAFQAESSESILNSPTALAVRRSIIDGNFKYCRWMRCPYILNDSMPATLRDSATSNVDRAQHLRLSYDYTCNLWCPSCRKERRTAKGEELDRILQLTDKAVLPMLQHAESCIMNGYGDVFASQACRKILGSLSRATHPNLRIDIITNGVLFTDKEWMKFPGIHDMVRHVRVSVDAATEGTYRSVRAGGDWDKLQDNLRFMSRLRKEGRIKLFSVTYVYQLENYLEMLDFAELAVALGCDLITFQPLMDWNTYPRPEFEARAIHRAGHPMRALFLAEAKKVQQFLPPADDSKLEEIIASGVPLGRPMVGLQI